jgi:hypothetical protein
MKIRQIAVSVTLATVAILTAAQPAAATERWKGPYNTQAECVTEQNDFVRHGYDIILQCFLAEGIGWQFVYESQLRV